MVVARKNSQLRVTISTEINEASCSDFVAVDRVNEMYLREARARELVSGGKVEGVPLQGTDISMATTYYTARLGSMFELTKYWHEVLGHATLEDMIRNI